ncbi:Uncharacterised protein [Mycobacteroides abscessus subsp. abscessus]|nr:Uncharacterised protein [Mycobacteroides abscessus subsp. abscessus]
MGAGAAAVFSPSAKYAISVMAPTVSSAQTACTRAPVVIPAEPAAPTSTACSKEVSAPSSLISAQANGLASGCPSSGSGCQDQDWTVPTLDTGTTSVNGA